MFVVSFDEFNGYFHKKINEEDYIITYTIFKENFTLRKLSDEMKERLMYNTSTYCLNFKNKVLC